MRRRHWAAQGARGGAVGATYPWAAVGINVSRMVCQLLSVRRPAHPSHALLMRYKARHIKARMEQV